MTGALIAGGASILGGVLQSEATSSAASSAAGAQTQAANVATAEQRRQFDALQKLLSPYVQAGEASLSQQQSMLGLSGPEAQQKSISAIEQSPYFQSMAQQGENAILQQASATGGLRGGNVQGALAQYRPQLLNQLVEQQYAKLGGLTNIGQASAAGVGSAGMGAASNIGNIQQAAGQGQAQAALMAGQGTANAIGGATQTLGTLGMLGMLSQKGAF